MSFRPGLGRVALVVSVLVGAAAELEGQGTGFQLFARMGVAMQVNRVSCGVGNDGELCVDARGSSTIGGGYWPKGSPQAYIFNSGMQIAGAIQAGIPGFAWSGDTTGAFFFDAKGTTQHSSRIETVWDHSDAEDRAQWPDEARVPTSGPASQLYAPELRGRPSASEGDLWTMVWEGDSALMAGRPHPLGVVLETRVLGWNSPKWNEDIVYFVHTLYNISSACAADYAAYEAPLRDRLVELGRQFQARNNARFGVTIPLCGYGLHSLYAGNAIDADVTADAGENYSSVNLPLGMGYAYHDLFRGTDGGYRLPSDLRGAPFLSGYGFVGTKFLEIPGTDSAPGGIRLYSNTGKMLGDGSNSQQLWRHMSGNITPALGDRSCNFGNPILTRVCYIKQDGHADMRWLQSTGPTTLGPGASISVVIAYVFSSAVAVPGCPSSPCPSVLPGNALRLTDAALLASGANLIDSISGFLSYQDDNVDGVVQGEEFRTVRGSFLHKAQLAQLIFDRGFSVPGAPTAPEFFLVPGDDQVAVLWRPSATETSGDSYFTVANDPASPAYDPNYRQFDTEGYRIYRGRTDDPARLTLIAQYDYWEEDAQGHPLAMRDYLGAVNPGTDCAPELGRNTIAEGCRINFDLPAPGTPYTAFTEWDIESNFIQVRLGDRFLDAVGDPYIVAEDTAVTGGGSGHPVLWNQGVPFVHIDSSARNNLRYFYSVVAFDVNSVQSGPSSLESPRVLKSVTPVAPASNYVNEATTESGFFGRGVNMAVRHPSTPTIDPLTGVFDRPARPATGASIGLSTAFIAQLVTGSGEFTLTLDSMTPGSAYDSNRPSTFWYRVTVGASSTPVTLIVPHDQFNVPQFMDGEISGPPMDGDRLARYGGSGDYRLSAGWQLQFPGNYYTAAFGRGCTNGAPGFWAGDCDYNGARWFDDSTETFAHPTQGNNNNNPTNAPVTNPTTAGSLAGLAHVYEARSYHTRPNTYRVVEGVLGTVATAADYRLWWGTNGTVDSVVDITHNVRLPFDADFERGYTWGFLTRGSQATTGFGITDQRNTAISVSDFGCVPPLRTHPAPSGHLACTGGPTYLLEDDISDLNDFAPVAFGNNLATDRTITPTTNQGFGMYIAGHLFLFEMNSPAPVAPAAGTLWTLRTYVGSINGGRGGPNGTAGGTRDYWFNAQSSPFTAVGGALSVQYTVANALRQTTRSDLSQVHTIPDPYYRTNSYETGDDQKVIKFVNLPDRAIIRIYTLSGILVKVIEHNSSTFGGQADWDVRNTGGRLVASGVYFYHLESPSGARRVGRMTLVTDGR
jgi:hypothetical protein